MESTIGKKYGACVCMHAMLSELLSRVVTSVSDIYHNGTTHKCHPFLVIR